MTNITIPSATTDRKIKFKTGDAADVGIAIQNGSGYPLGSIGVNRAEFLKVVRAFGVTPEELKEPKKSAVQFVTDLPVGAVFKYTHPSIGEEWVIVKVQDNGFEITNSRIHKGSIYPAKGLIGYYHSDRTEDNIEVIFPKN